MADLSFPKYCDSDFCKQEIFHTKYAWAEHLWDMHHHRRYHCSICNRSLGTEYELKRHFLHDHLDESLKFISSSCPTKLKISYGYGTEFYNRTDHLSGNDKNGCFKCNQPNCHVCEFIDPGERVIGEENDFKIVQNLSCRSLNAIYVVSCRSRNLYVN